VHAIECIMKIQLHDLGSPGQRPSKMFEEDTLDYNTSSAKTNA
jgi:hypothetical protein